MENTEGVRTPAFGYFYADKPQLVFQKEGIQLTASGLEQGGVVLNENGQITVQTAGCYEIIFSVAAQSDDAAIFVNGAPLSSAYVFGRTPDKERIASACIVQLNSGDTVILSSKKSKVFSLPTVAGNSAAVTVKGLF